MQTEIIVAIIGAVAIILVAIIGVIEARRKKGSNESATIVIEREGFGRTSITYTQTAKGNNNIQIQINK